MSRERIEELLALRSLDGLAADEERELRALAASATDPLGVDVDVFDRALAELSAESIEPQPLPAALAERLAADAERFAAHRRAEREAAPVVPIERARASRRVPGVVWAAAGALAASLVFLLRGPAAPPPGVPTPPPGLAVAEAPASPAEERAELLAEREDVRMTRLTATDDPSAEEWQQGDVVWSNSAQEGYLRLRGLQTNNRNAEQYQLWIFDRAQDERHPIDGGVFDVSEVRIGPDGYVTVPVDAKLPVVEPYLFAVTVEKPGGVVVSSRERIALLGEL